MSIDAYARVMRRVQLVLNRAPRPEYPMLSADVQMRILDGVRLAADAGVLTAEDVRAIHAAYVDFEATVGPDRAYFVPGHGDQVLRLPAFTFEVCLEQVAGEV